MTYDIAENWKAIIDLLERAKQSGKYATIATNGTDGFPNVAPIGCIFPNGIGDIFYFDEYATQTSQNIENDNRVTIQLVDSSPLFWLSFLLNGKFNASLGIRLKGFAGKK